MRPVKGAHPQRRREPRTTRLHPCRPPHTRHGGPAGNSTLGGGNRPDRRGGNIGRDGLTGCAGQIARIGLTGEYRLDAGKGLAGHGAKAGEIGIEDGGRYENLCGRNFRRGRVGFNRHWFGF